MVHGLVLLEPQLQWNSVVHDLLRGMQIALKLEILNRALNVCVHRKHARTAGFSFFGFFSFLPCFSGWPPGSPAAAVLAVLATLAAAPCETV